MTRLTLEQVYTTYYGRMKGLAYSILKDWVGAHDAAVDSIIAAFQKLDDDTTDEHLIRYLYASVRNRCMDIYRRKHIFEEINDRLDVAYYDHYRIEAGLSTEVLIEKLHPARKKVIQLDLMGYDSEHIAKKLNQALSSIYRTRGRALADLRVLFKRL